MHTHMYTCSFFFFIYFFHWNNICREYGVLTGASLAFNTTNAESQCGEYRMMTNFGVTQDPGSSTQHQKHNRIVAIHHPSTSGTPNHMWMEHKALGYQCGERGQFTWIVHAHAGDVWHCVAQMSTPGCVHHGRTDAPGRGGELGTAQQTSSGIPTFMGRGLKEGALPSPYPLHPLLHPSQPWLNAHHTSVCLSVCVCVSVQLCIAPPPNLPSFPGPAAPCFPCLFFFLLFCSLCAIYLPPWGQIALSPLIQIMFYWLWSWLHQGVPRKLQILTAPMNPEALSFPGPLGSKFMYA